MFFNCLLRTITTHFSLLLPQHTTPYRLLLLPADNVSLRRDLDRTQPRREQVLQPAARAATTAAAAAAAIAREASEVYVGVGERFFFRGVGEEDGVWRVRVAFFDEIGLFRFGVGFRSERRGDELGSLLGAHDSGGPGSEFPQGDFFFFFGPFVLLQKWDPNWVFLNTGFFPFRLGVLCLCLVAALISRIVMKYEGWNFEFCLLVVLISGKW